MERGKGEETFFLCFPVHIFLKFLLHFLKLWNDMHIVSVYTTTTLSIGYSPAFP